MKRILTLASLTAALVLAACGGSNRPTDDTSAQSKQAAPRMKTGATAYQASDYQAAVQYLYLAYFGRPADPTGLTNFENALLAANAPPDIGSLAAAYATNPQVKTLIDSFGTSKESQTLYGSGNSSAFVTAVFQNVLGRAPQSSGLTYWSGAIDSGSLSQGNAALSIMAAALTNGSAQGQLDAQLIGQRLSEAESFTAQVSLQGATADYSGASAAAAARSLLGSVTATTDPVAFSTSIDGTLGTLLGPSIELLAGGTGGPGSNDGNVAVAHFGGLNGPSGLWVDGSGNLLIVDNETIRKITPAGTVSTIAGAAAPYTSAGVQTYSSLGYPANVVADAQGNLYATEGYSLYKITPAGTISTLSAQFGVLITLPNSFGPTLYASLSGLAIDSAGNLYVADSYGNGIYKVTPDGTTTVLAGTPGVTGAADGQGAAASFNGPQGMTIDSAGNLYVADSKNGVIRKITPGGTVSTLQAGFTLPFGVALDAAGNVYVTESGANVVSVLANNGVTTTLAGQRTSNSPTVTGGYSDGTGSAAQFKKPEGIGIGSDGNIYVVDSGNDAIRKITPAGVVTNMSGAPAATTSADRTGAGAAFKEHSGVAVDGAGNVYVSDYAAFTIRKITPAGVATTLAGTPGINIHTEPEGAPDPSAPTSVAVDASGNVYYGDVLKLIEIAPSGATTTLATSNLTGNLDGYFAYPTQIVFDGAGNIYFGDSMSGYVHKLTPAGVVTKVLNTQGDASQFWYTSGIAIDAAGNLYVSDSYYNTITKITPAGVFTLLAGQHAVAGYADGTGTGTLFNGPTSLALDAAGNLYVADTQNNVIRKITPAGVVSTVVGKAGVQGVALGAFPGGLSGPAAIAIDKNGILYAASASGVLKIRLP